MPLLRLVIMGALAVWAWRRFFGARGPQQRATAAYADGSSIVFEPGSSAFERLAEAARPALRG